MTLPPAVTEETLNHLLVDSKIQSFAIYPPSGLHIFLDSGAILTMCARDDGELDIDILGPHDPEGVPCYECEEVSP